MDDSILFENLTFEQAVSRIRKERLTMFRVQPFLLDTAQTNFKFAMAGNFLYALETTDANVSINVRVNNLSEQTFTLRQGLGCVTPFQDLYFTWEAQAGKSITLVIGVEAKKFLEFIDNRSQAQSTSVLEEIRDQLKGDTAEENWDTEKTIGTSASLVLASNSNRKSFVVQSKESNTGLIYLGFGSSVTSSKWFKQLEPGETFGLSNILAPIYAISDTAGQLLGYGEW